jgi:hypothetical protein
MPEMRINSLKSLAMNCGPLSEMIRGLAPGNFSLARPLSQKAPLSFRLDTVAATPCRSSPAQRDSASELCVRPADVAKSGPQ